MDVRTLFPTEYIASHDLAGKDVNLTISRVVVEDLRTTEGSERKPIVYFEEMEERNRKDRNQPNKKLVLNKTNAKVIAGLLGYETDDWGGKRITLFATTCQAFGETVDCIRIRDKAPPAKRSAKTDERQQAIA